MDDRNWGNGWSDHRDRSSPSRPPIEPEPWSERSGGWTRTSGEWNNPSESGSWYRYDVGGPDEPAEERWDEPSGEWLYPEHDPRGIAGRDTDLAIPRQRDSGPVVGPGAWHQDSDEWERLRPPVRRSPGQHAGRGLPEPYGGRSLPDPLADWIVPEPSPPSGPRHGLRAIEGAPDRYPVPFRRPSEPPERGSHSPPGADQPYWPVIGWTVAWFTVPLLGYLVWALTQDSHSAPGCLTDNGGPCPAPRADALHGLLDALPRVALALAIGMVVALVIRRISETWRAVVIAFAGGVIGAAVVTAVFTVIGPSAG